MYYLYDILYPIYQISNTNNLSIFPFVGLYYYNSIVFIDKGYIYIDTYKDIRRKKSFECRLKSRY